MKKSSIPWGNCFYELLIMSNCGNGRQPKSMRFALLDRAVW